MLCHTSLTVIQGGFSVINKKGHVVLKPKSESRGQGFRGALHSGSFCPSVDLQT